MKKQKLNSKLNLKKITISKLDSNDLQSFMGGGSDVLCSNPYCPPKPSQRVCPDPDPSIYTGTFRIPCVTDSKSC